MECDADGRGGAHPLQGHEGFGETGMAPLHRDLRGRFPPARAGNGLDWGGSRQGKPLLDVVGLLLVFLPLAILNFFMVLQSSCLEV